MTRPLGSGGRWIVTLYVALIALALGVPLGGCTPTPDGGEDPGTEPEVRSSRGSRESGTRTSGRRGSRRGSSRRGSSDTGTPETARGDTPTENGDTAEVDTPVDGEQPVEPGPVDPADPIDPTDPAAGGTRAALLAEIEQLKGDVASRDAEIGSLQDRVKSLEAAAGGDEALLTRITELEQEQKDARIALAEKETQIQEEREAHAQKIEKLERDLANAGGLAAGGESISELLDQVKTLTEEKDAIKLELSGAQTVNKAQLKQINDLINERDGAVESLAAFKTEKEKAEQDVARLMNEKTQLEKDLEELEAGATEAQQDIKKEVGAATKKAEEAMSLATTTSGEITGIKDQITDAKNKQGSTGLFALIGLAFGLIAVGLAVWLLRENKSIKYQLAFQHAQGGGLDPAELDSIVTSRVQEVAQSLGGGGGGADPEQVRALLGAELQSEAFHNRLKSLVSANAKAAAAADGGGGGGGGLSPEDVKVMVDNQFRAITTYLKNEAVPKMVEDALKRRGDA